KTDSMVDEKYSLLVNHTFDNFLDYQSINPEQISETYRQKITPIVARLILIVNDDNCDDRDGDLHRSCGTKITRFGSQINDKDLCVRSDVMCLIHNANFRCPQVEKIGNYGINITDLCDTTVPWALPSSNDWYCHDSRQFVCTSYDDPNIDFCFGGP
ncbi:36020_t:CDS:2, partial [Racocetra persica]